MSWSVQAAVTNHCRLGSLNNRQLFLMVLGPEKSEIRVPAQRRFGVGALPVCRWPPSCRVLLWWRAERERAGSLVSLLIRALIPLKWLPPEDLVTS